MGTARLQVLHVCVAGLSLAGMASRWQAAHFSGVLCTRHAIVSSAIKALSGHLLPTSSPLLAVVASQDCYVFPLQIPTALHAFDA